MKKRLRNGISGKRKLRTKIVRATVVVTGTLLLTISCLVYMNFHQLSKTRATGNDSGGGGNMLNNGAVISEFTWEDGPVTKATLGPDATDASKEAHVMRGGRASSSGLAPGEKGKDIDLVIPASPQFNQDGIDIGIDFRRNETDGNFFTRGNYFNFGMKDGYIAIAYRIDNGKSIETVSEKTTYEIPTDPSFRNYRFIYTPSTGRAEIFVNSVIVWSYTHKPNSPLVWKESDDIVIGKGMNGGGVDKTVFDNLVIRSTGSIIPMSETLLHFTVEPSGNEVHIKWASAASGKVQSFTIERSVNGTDFSNVTTINADPSFTADDEYAYTDFAPASSPIVYYRLRQTFFNGKFITHPLSAIRNGARHNAFYIENISPSPWEKDLNIIYNVPENGRVWMQLTDRQGKIVSTRTFEALRGKNVHVFTPDVQFESGTYKVDLIFENKKVSTEVVRY